MNHPMHTRATDVSSGEGHHPTGFARSSSDQTEGTDYLGFFKIDIAEQAIQQKCASRALSVVSESGHDVRSSPNSNGFWEYCCFDDDVLLVASKVQHGISGRRIQLTTDGDWLHLQFRVAGGGHERVDGYDPVATPEGSCAIIRAPTNSKTLREYQQSGNWSCVCLYVRPRSIRSFFGLSGSSFAPEFDWLTDPAQIGFKAHVTPMSVGMRQCVQSLLENPFDGEARRTYLKAKTLELFTHTARNLNEGGERTDGVSSSDYAKLNQLMRILESDVSSPMTLASLARKVGTNRTRLATLFKQCNGITLQAYRRKYRLNEAMRLLTSQRLQVTEVAEMVGYSVSSLSRAFVEEFGVLPKDVRPPR